MKLNDFINIYGDITVDENELKELLGMNKYFMPAKGEGYWYSNHKGEVLYFDNGFDDFDKLLFKHCDVFKTKEEAEEHVRKKVFLLQMKRDFLDNSDKIDWEDDDQEKYCLKYTYKGDEIFVHYNRYLKTTGLVTTSEEWLLEYISEYEEEIKKYYFEVEEKEEEK